MDNLSTVTTWVGAHRGVSITAACAVGALLLAVAAGQLWATYRGRELSARAAMLFAVVQAGVAFVTITGVFEFWDRRVGMPIVEAALIAAFVEAVTWAAVADIYVHGSRIPPTVGLGPSGGLFWAAVAGGGIMAVIGSETIAVAIGRTVVVTLGAMMWHVRIRQHTTRPTIPGRWVNPFNEFALRRGWKTADDLDVKRTSREFQVRTLTRAINLKARPGRVHSLARWRGERAIRRVMEAGDAAMVKDAQRRYALAEVLRTEIAPTSASMSAAIHAARDALRPTPDPTPEPESAPAAPSEVPVEPEPVTPVRPRPAPRRVAAVARTTAAATARQDPAAAEALRERATAEAADALGRGEMLTGRDWGVRYGKGEEWGRQRLIDARKRLDTDPVSLNGSRVG